MALGTWTAIPDGDFDANSPLTDALMEDIVENIEHNYSYLGGNTYTPAENHNHDNVNSAPVASTSLLAVEDTEVGTQSEEAAGSWTSIRKYKIHVGVTGTPTFSLTGALRYSGAGGGDEGLHARLNINSGAQLLAEIGTNNASTAFVWFTASGAATATLTAGVHDMWLQLKKYDTATKGIIKGFTISLGT